MNNVDLPLPNIYFVTVQSVFDATPILLYVAADFTGSALKKVQNICADQHNFRPYRSNSVIKMRRLKLADMLECPEALGKALDTAHLLGERDTIARLASRPAEVRRAVAKQGGLGDHHAPDAERICRILGEALRQAEALK